MSTQALEGSLLGVGTVLRLERDAWSKVQGLRQATNQYATPHPLPTSCSPRRPSPDACGSQHATEEAWVRLEWSSRTDTSFSIVPAAKLYHQRMGWKIAVSLHPAATASGASTVEWPSESTRGGGGGENAIREFTAGELMEIVVQARDTNGNHRGVGERGRGVLDIHA